MTNIISVEFVLIGKFNTALSLKCRIHKHLKISECNTDTKKYIIEWRDIFVIFIY